MVVNQQTGQIICTAFGKARVHDFRLFKLEQLPMLPEQLCLADKRYQGLFKLHSSSCLPTKKPRQRKLVKSERQHNRLLARLRIVDVKYQASAQPFLVLGMLVAGLALGHA